MYARQFEKGFSFHHQISLNEQIKFEMKPQSQKESEMEKKK